MLSALPMFATDISVQKEFTYLQEDMPSSLRIGQNASFNLSLADIEIPAGADASFESAVLSASISVPEAGFSALDMTGSLSYTADGNILSFSLNPVSDTYLDGKLLKGAALIMSSQADFSEGFNILEAISSFSADAFSISFETPETGTVSSGCVSTMAGFPGNSNISISGNGVGISPAEGQDFSGRFTLDFSNSPIEIMFGEDVFHIANGSDFADFALAWNGINGSDGNVFQNPDGSWTLGLTTVSIPEPAETVPFFTLAALAAAAAARRARRPRA